MGKECSLCGSYRTDDEINQFKQIIHNKLRTYYAKPQYDVSFVFICEKCGKKFCESCWQNKVYNGKSIDWFRHTTSTGKIQAPHFASDMYLCSNCGKIDENKICKVCNNILATDKEGHFNGKHVGYHIKCQKCDNFICLDCATGTENPKKFLKKCPYCDNKNWVKKHRELLLKNYDINLAIFNKKNEKFKCNKCNNGKTIFLFCSSCGEVYCPNCILEHDPKKKSTCPSCGKSGFKKYKNQLVLLSKENN
ncbi:MAG: hypothetical protein ACFFAS_09600 [Promethearchaeota archaeon]